MADEHEFDEVVDEAVEDATDEQEERRDTAHEERVARFAERFAGLVAKGEEVLGALNAKADAADTSFAQKTAAANQKLEGFAASMQAQMDRAADQIARDLDVIAKAVNAATVTDEEGADAAPYVPQFTPATQAFREHMGVDATSTLMATDPEFVERFGNFAFDEVVGQIDLPDRTRFLCWIATLVGCQGVDEFRVMADAALNVGVEPEAIQEVVYQATAYLGIGRTYPFLNAKNELFATRGIALPLERQAQGAPDEESRYVDGERAQMEAIGAHMQGYAQKGHPDYPHIAQWLVKNCFGDYYARDGLTMAEREMCTFCYIAAQGGCEPQLRAHAAANVQCGNDRDFLIKVVSNNVPFIGYPRSLNAMAVVEEVTGAQE